MPAGNTVVSGKLKALARSILLSLTEVDRDAMLRFYAGGETADQIEKALGLDAGYVERLKRLIKARFLQDCVGLETTRLLASYSNGRHMVD